MNEIVLWGLPASPFVRKVMIALAEKKLSYQHHPILPIALLKQLQQPIPDDFIKASPLGKVPALVVDGFAIADSSVITAYLDKQFANGTRLYPADPKAYARTLWFERYADVEMMKVIHRVIFIELVVKAKVLKQAPDQAKVQLALTKRLPPILEYLDSSLANSEYLVDETFTIADVAVAVQLASLAMAGHGFNPTQWPHLARFNDQLLSRVTVAQSFNVR